MNARAVRWLVGNVALLLALAFLVPAAVSAVHGEETAVRAFLISCGVAAAIGAVLVATNRRSLRAAGGRPAVFRREGIAVVALGWILACCLGALPFLLGGATGSVVDALFESTSGFTTTGSSILDAAEIDALPHGVNFWRCFSQWIGGIGIILVFVLVLPAGARSLFRSEGIERQVTEALARDSAVALLRVYATLTAAQTVLLLVAGLDPFDAVCHAFTSVSTGGFSTRGASVGHYASVPVEAICIVFMVAGGTDFSFWAARRRRLRDVLAVAARSSELRLFLALLIGFTVFLTVLLWLWGGSNGRPGSDLPDYSSFGRALRDAAFNLVSVQSTTGFATADFDRWPDSCRTILVVASIVGASTGSTGGGIKVLRLLIAARAALASVRSYARPRAIVRVRVDGRPQDEDVLTATTRYFALWVLVATAAVLVLTILGTAPTEALTGVVATLNTTGPGLGGLGPNSNFGVLNDASTLVFTVLMLLGRLELFAFVSILLPGFWRR